MDVDTINVIALAYLGDAIYEVYIRKMLVDRGIQKVDLLQKEAVEYVSAKGQAKLLTYLLDNNLLKEKEIDVVKRGRNNKRSSHPKNTDIITYKMSTGFEALIGYLYYEKEFDRLMEIFNYIGVV